MQKIIHGDCLEKLREIADSSVDAVVTDPPYGISFMGKRWDHSVPSVDVWRECLRVLKPGGHMLVACGTRTQHRMVVNIEDAGLEIRDVITWLYGSGFPKSLDVSKAIDKAAGAEREVVGMNPSSRPNSKKSGMRGFDGRDGAPEESAGIQTLTAPSTGAAKQWQGWGTALKPACEFWTLARKPLAGTVAQNVYEHGTGALNIDGCRIEAFDHPGVHHAGNSASGSLNWNSGEKSGSSKDYYTPSGRWPANLILDEVAAGMLDEQSGTLKSGARAQGVRQGMGYHGANGVGGPEIVASMGGASRFSYVAKSSKTERNAGLDDLPEVRFARSNAGKAAVAGTSERTTTNESGYDKIQLTKNHHPTVKPIKLMRYLCRLITPPGGLVLDPFAGSGSTGVGATAEGFDFIGIEREAEYVAIATARLAASEQVSA